MTSYKTLLYEVKNNAARITLNRPEVRNAINHDMEVEFKNALLRGNDDDEAGMIIVTGAPPAFCSGIDLRVHHKRTPVETRAHFESFYWGFHKTHRSLDKPTLAVLNGPAREAGCTIAFMCDMILAAESASIGLPAIDRAILPAYHLMHLPRIVGRLKAFEICFSGTPIEAREAEQLMIFNKVVPDADLAEETEFWVERFAHKSRAVMKLGKEAFYRGQDMEFEKSIRMVGDVVAIVAGLDDAKEGIGAFLEKRDPDWKDE
ncbi:MAG: enoyl-CoA hydratase [Rhodospirillaceae bacterium]|nr:enoyl-CoA hydratase [Rhodospirillaceae bacterium]